MNIKKLLKAGLARYIEKHQSTPKQPRGHAGSNHARARRRPRGWHQDLRAARKRQKRARREQRGKR